jgi:spermidine synthase
MSTFADYARKLVYRATGWRVLESKDEISVINKGNLLVLKEGFKTYSAIRTDTLYTRLYYDYFIPLAYLYSKPEILVVGIGGGTTPFQLSRLLGNEVKLHGVDTNARMVYFAKKYFIRDVDIDISIADGARYVSKEKRRFDLVLLDAYEHARIPQQFLEETFISNASEALKDDGILAINSVLGPLDLIAYLQKLGKYFKVYHLRPNLTSDNVFIVCSKRLDRDEIFAKIQEKMPRNDENAFLFDGYSSIRA